VPTVSHRPAGRFDRLSGWLILAAILLSITRGLGAPLPALLPGIAFWGAGLLLAARIRGAQRLQTGLMLLVGAGGVVYAASVGGEPAWAMALGHNQALLAMLAGVSFLRLVALPEVDRGEPDPRGAGALWRTLIGVHLFGAVINLSAVMIFGDRQSRRAPMTSLQATVLSRGFALAAHWSPFFAAMGVALSHAPGADWKTVSLVGLPLALTGLLLSGWRLARRGGAADFVGFPVRFEAMWIPATLAAVVLGWHHLAPDLPILTLISSASIALTVLVLLLRLRRGAGARLVRHIDQGLPGMSGELALFLAAGVLAAGIHSAVQGVGWQLGPGGFDATSATMLVSALVLLSVVGVHPVIGISVASGILAPLAPNPELMAVTYLMAWAAGVSASPFSGMHLGMQGRFGVPAAGFLRWNGPFTLVMLAVYAIALHLFEALR
jgi:hypothetical protein